LTDRALPHLLPVGDPVLFKETVEQAVGVEQPPPVAYLSTGATTYAALASLVTNGFFAPNVRTRLAVVFTDGESRPYNLPGIARLLNRDPPLHTVFVHVWGASERVYTNGVPESRYKPDPASGAGLVRLANAARGQAFDERQLQEAARAVRRLVGPGPTVSARRTTEQVSIAPFLVLGTIAPLLLLAGRTER
jgi:hypothetical protein